jgi:hypothetical protein
MHHLSEWPFLKTNKIDLAYGQMFKLYLGTVHLTLLTIALHLLAQFTKIAEKHERETSMDSCIHSHCLAK